MCIQNSVPECIQNGYFNTMYIDVLQNSQSKFSPVMQKSVKSSCDLEAATRFNRRRRSVCFLIITQHPEEFGNFFIWYLAHEEWILGRPRANILSAPPSSHTVQSRMRK